MLCVTWYKNWYLLLVCIIYSLSYFYRNSISPIADVLEKELNTTSTGIGMLSSFLYGSYFSMQLVVGLLLEIYSFRILILFSSLFLGLSMFIFTFTSNVTMGIIIRFLSGFIVSPPYVTGIAMSARLFGIQYVSMYSGLMFFSGNLFVLFSAYLQAYIYDEYNDWKSVYLFFATCSIFISILFFCIIVFEYFYHYKANIMIKNSLLLTEKSEINIDAKSNNGYESIHEITSIGDENDIFIENKKPSFFQFVVYRQRKVEIKNIRSTLWHSLKLTVKNKYNYYLGLHSFCFFTIIYAMNGLWIINYLMEKYGYSRELSSIISGVFFLGTAFGSLIFGKLAQIYEKRIVLLTISAFIMLFATISIIYFTNKETPLYIMIMLSAINGIGSGSSTPVHYTLVREYNHQDDCQDTATGFVNVQRASAGFLAQFAMGVMIDINWINRGGGDYNIDDPNTRHYNVSDYNFAFSLCTISCAISLILLFFLKETNGKINIITRC